MARLVLDTSAFVAALRSPSGASKALLDGALKGDFELLISPALVFEYEAVAARAEHLAAARMERADLDLVLDAVVAAGRWTHIDYRLRPILSDPDDEMVLELAVNGAADVLATFNVDDFAHATDLVQLLVRRPSEALAFLRSLR